MESSVEVHSYFMHPFLIKIIITNGFIKKAQATSRREIKLAKAFRKDYLEIVKVMSEF